MHDRPRWWRHSIGIAALAAGLIVTGCDSGSTGSGGGATATVNLSSLPAAEAWVDGKSAGSTPLAVPLSPGRHEVVLKQAGFSEHRQTLDVAPGAVASVDATLLPDDPMDPESVRLVAAAYGITVEPFRAPEVHRGAASVGGVALLFPRNDVRKEGLLNFRVDVTPAYEGGGFLEFRKGKTSLYRAKFEPETLVNTSTLPKSVLDAVKTGDTVTWGIYFTDARKPITAQFEVVAKPTASKKLAELSADRRLAAQPAALRQQLEAEVLQNYRLYSEALVRLLDMRAADKDNTAPYTGIVSCLRRLDLEDSALFTEAASKAVGVTSRHRGPNAGSGVAGKRNPVGTMPSGGAPASDGAEAAPLAAPTAPGTAPAATAPAAAAPNPASAPGSPVRPDPTPGAPTLGGPVGTPAQPAPLAPSVGPMPGPEAPALVPVKPGERPTAPGQASGSPAPVPQAPGERPTAPNQPTTESTAGPTPLQPGERPTAPTQPTDGAAGPVPQQPGERPTAPSKPADGSNPVPQQPGERPTAPSQPSEGSAPAPTPVPVPVPSGEAPPAPNQPESAPVPPAPVPPAPMPK